MTDNPVLSDLARFRMLASREASEQSQKLKDENRKEALRRVKRAQREAAYEDEERERHIKKYVVPLMNPYTPTRRAAQRKVAREVKDPDKRMWILDRAIRGSDLIGKKKRADFDDMNFIQRLARKVHEIPEAFFEGSAEMAESYKSLGRVIGGGDRDKKELVFRDYLEGAYLSGDPGKSSRDTLAHKAVKGTAGIAPQVLSGIASYKIAGKIGIAATAGTQDFSGQRERLMREGVGETGSNVLAALTSTGTGVIESMIPVPGGGKSGVGGIGREVGFAAAKKLGLKGMKAKAGGIAGGVLAEFAGEVGGEEFAQAGLGAASSLAGAAVSGQTEGRRLAEIPEEALAGAGEALLPMAGISLIGGGGQASKAVQSAKTRRTIIRLAKENKAPSRREQKEMGLPYIKSAPDRLKNVQEMALGYHQMAKAEREATAVDKRQLSEEKVDVPEAPAEFTEAVAETPSEQGSFRDEFAPVSETEKLDRTLQDEKNRVVNLADGLVDAKAEAQKEPSENDTDADMQQAVADFLADESGAMPIGQVFIDDAVAGLQGETAANAIKSPDKEHEAALARSNAPSTRPGVGTRVLGMMKTFGKAAVRANKHIPNTGKEWELAREVWRLKRASQAAGRQMAVNKIAQILRTPEMELGPTQMLLFERYLVASDQLRALYRMDSEANPETGEMELVSKPEPLRHRLKSVGAGEAYVQQLKELVARTPKVAAALEMRGQIVRSLAEKLVKAGKLNESALEDVESYVHHQVLLYRNAFRQGQGEGKSWMKKRVIGPKSLGKDFDYNTSYIEPEMAWMANAYSKLFDHEYHKAIDEKYNKAEEYIAKAKESDRSLGSIARENKHTAVRKRLLYGSSASGVESVIQAMFEQQVAEDSNMTDEEVDLAVGGNGSEIMVLPDEIVAQLHEDSLAERSNELQQIKKDMVKAWKAWTLLNPKRIIGYNLRNISGDIDPVIAVDPMILKYVGKSMAEMTSLLDPTKEQSKDVQNTLQYGVLGSGFAVGELSEAGDLPIFKEVGKRGFGRYTSWNPITAYTRMAKAGTELRENVLRHASYLRHLELIKEGKISHYGASWESAVKEIQKYLGDEAAAAHMSRNLLGDYGNLSQLGNAMRSNAVPFWSFVEVNMTRYPKILVNAFKSGKSVTATGVSLSTIATARIASLWGSTWIWNNYIYPLLTGDWEAEEGLGDFGANGMHIITGRNSDNTIRVYRNIGALGDLMEWFGINEVASMVPRAVDGQIEWSEIGREVVTAPLEKIIRLLGPHYKAVAEMVGGQSYFPDPTDPRPQDRDEAVANVFGLSNELNSLKGKVLESGEHSDKHYWKKYLGASVIDPRTSDLFTMYNLKDAYYKSIGKERPGAKVISEYKNARDAAINDNKRAFFDWRARFIEKHGRRKATDRFWRHQKRVDPFGPGSMSKADRIGFHRFLKTGQREQLRNARELSAAITVKQALWWREAARADQKGM